MFVVVGIIINNNNDTEEEDREYHTMALAATIEFNRI